VDHNGTIDQLGAHRSNPHRATYLAGVGARRLDETGEYEGTAPALAFHHLVRQHPRSDPLFSIWQKGVKHRHGFKGEARQKTVWQANRP